MTGQPPTLPGYNVKPTPDGDGWEATAIDFPRVLRGRTRAELYAARDAAFQADLDAIKKRISETDLSGYPRAGSWSIP